jgi:hypothetical protein
MALTAKAGLVRSGRRLRLPGRNGFNYCLAFSLGQALGCFPPQDVANLAKTVSVKQRDAPVQLAGRIPVAASENSKSAKDPQPHGLNNLTWAHLCPLAAHSLASALGSGKSVVCTNVLRV